MGSNPKFCKPHNFTIDTFNSALLIINGLCYEINVQHFVTHSILQADDTFTTRDLPIRSSTMSNK